MMNYNELRERTEAVTGVDVDELIERVRALSVVYGTQKARVEYMADFRKAKLYSIVEERRAEFEEARQEGDRAPTEARLEAIARASKEYKQFLKRAYDEKVSLVQAEAEYFAARNKLESIMEMLKYARSEQYFHSKN